MAIKFVVGAALAGVLNTLWVGVAIAAVAGALGRYLLRTNAATRHLLGWAALVLVLLVPLAAPAAPASAPSPSTTESRNRRRSTDALTLVITMRIGADLSVGASKQRVEHPCADRGQLRGIRSRRSGAAGKHLRAGVVQLLRLP